MFGNKNSDDYINDANKSITQGYNQAASYESPYTTYGASDFDAGRNYLYKSLGGRQNYNENFLKYLTMSPEDMLNEAMSGYDMSPMAEEEQTYALDAANNAETASGMGGSSNNSLLDAEIGNTIFNQDSSRYEDQLMQALGIQSKVLKGYDKQTSDLMSYFQDMLRTEEGASSNMANNAIKSSQYAANADERGATESVISQRNHMHEASQLLNDIFSGFGMAKGGSDSKKQSSGIASKLSKVAGLVALA
jgi:hypothetical protein